MKKRKWRKKKEVEDPGIDPGTSRMLSERSTMWANPPAQWYHVSVNNVNANTSGVFWKERSLNMWPNLESCDWGHSQWLLKNCLWPRDHTVKQPSILWLWQKSAMRPPLSFHRIWRNTYIHGIQGPNPVTELSTHLLEWPSLVQVTFSLWPHTHRFLMLQTSHKWHARSCYTHSLTSF